MRLLTIDVNYGNFPTMLDRAKNFLRKIAGETPGGAAHPVVEAVMQGQISLGQANKVFDRLERTTLDPMQTLRGAYEKAIKEASKKDRPHTPRRDALMY